MMGNDFVTIDASSPPHGADGFFSYDMNIDLKHNKPLYIPSPLLLYLSKNAQNDSNEKANGHSFYVRLLFSPSIENDVSAPDYNSTYPANRWRSYATRHNKGGNIVLLDGHVEYFKSAVIRAGGNVGTCTRQPRRNIPGRL